MSKSYREVFVGNCLNCRVIPVVNDRIPWTIQGSSVVGLLIVAITTISYIHEAFPLPVQESDLRIDHDSIRFHVVSLVHTHHKLCVV